MLLVLPIFPRIAVCMLLSVPEGYFLNFYVSEYGDVRALKVYVSTLLLYDKVCFQNQII